MMDIKLFKDTHYITKVDPDILHSLFEVYLK